MVIWDRLVYIAFYEQVPRQYHLIFVSHVIKKIQLIKWIVPQDIISHIYIDSFQIIQIILSYVLELTNQE